VSLWRSLGILKRVSSPYIIDMEVSEASNFMEILSKAMAGKLTKDDIEVEVIKPILPDACLLCTYDRKFIEDDKSLRSSYRIEDIIPLKYSLKNFLYTPSKPNFSIRSSSLSTYGI